uniref:Uncharacterized protein n=1 Tax=Hyaloperonospora arabidopsidis (strain Emoy2) TaxID=559515 RepID=M4B6X8_HYAAE
MTSIMGEAYGLFFWRDKLSAFIGIEYHYSMPEGFMALTSVRRTLTLKKSFILMFTSNIVGIVGTRTRTTTLCCRIGAPLYAMLRKLGVKPG